ncbi:MAG: hypothetical protein CSA40_00355, partial [Flavobacteriales bacterium]
FAMFAFVLFFAVNFDLYAQTSSSQDQKCQIEYNKWRVDAKNKNYESAYEPWLWTFENCPKLSINIYKVGAKIAEYRYENCKDASKKEEALALVKKVAEQRLEYYPDKSPARVYSDLAMFLRKANAPEADVFNYLEKAYNTKASDMGVVAIPLFFQGYIERNRNSNVQDIFNMYDNLNEVIEEKMNAFSKKLDEYTKIETDGGELNAKQTRLKKAYSTNLEGLGQAASVITDMSEEFATCDRLIPLYEAEFDKMQNDIKWLKRGASRLQKKGCTDSNLYDRIVEKYVNIDQSPSAYVAYANLQMKKSNETKALEYFKKAVDLESDAYKKADILLTIAMLMKDKGRFSEARSYAKQALQSRSSFGKAYLLIAQMYASSARSCGGGDVFKTRMIYQAALAKAQRARTVDPGITSLANKFINSYASKAPSKEDVFVEGLTPGSTYNVGCWIGESVRVP